MNILHIPVAVHVLLAVWIFVVPRDCAAETSQGRRAAEEESPGKPVAEPTVIAKGMAHEVNSLRGVRAALRKARPGERILLRPGTYAGNLYLSGFQGRPDAYLLIGAADPSHPPILKVGQDEAVKLSNVSYVALQDLIVDDARRNAFNIDDNGNDRSPSHHIVLRRINIRRMKADAGGGPIKLAGVKQFTIEKCNVSDWGKNGYGIDLIGCHEGTVKECVLRNNSDGGNTLGIQAKGGSTDIIVRNCLLEHVGARGIQIGGNTGMRFFRPQPPSGFEARNITVQGNILVGCEAAVTFVNVDGSVFSRNTVYRPTGYVVRILQETAAEGFVPCRKGVIADNIIVFRSGKLHEAVNEGRGTEPRTFQFARNWWYCENNPAGSRLKLPVAEDGGVYGKDPRFVDAPGGNFHLKKDSPATKFGAYSSEAE